MAQGAQELQREVIDLRMKEYETLRNEVTQRINARQQMAGYAAAITAITATWGGDLGPWRFLVVAMVLLAAVGYLRDSNKGIQRIGLHLQELETDINGLAQELYGRPVLSWETRRQGQRDREKWVWRITGIVGGWHLRKPSKELPSPRASTENASANRTTGQD
ncbi:hypothetical protein [Streptomyces sp. NPDC051219]|uniref:hypothetical protein n=1 Tax=Streptomyces sp. NPDC051219 TaxID=3155283 RepID=UPI003432B4EA